MMCRVGCAISLVGCPLEPKSSRRWDVSRWSSSPSSRSSEPTFEVRSTPHGGAARATIGQSLPRASGTASMERSLWRCCMAQNPSIFVVDTALVAFLVASDLARRSRWTRWYRLAAPGCFSPGLPWIHLRLLQSSSCCSLGYFLAGHLRWLLGAPSVRPSIPELINWLSEYGLRSAPSLRPTPMSLISLAVFKMARRSRFAWRTVILEDRD
jgi:hypothetical protein